MRWNRIVRHVLVLMLPVCLLVARAAVAQPPPPPPLTPLPPPPQPPGNQVTTAKANLGKALFWDEQISSTRTMACGTCHQPRRGGSDARTTPGSVRSVHPGLDGVRGTPDDILGSPGVVLNQADGAFAWAPNFGVQEQVTTRMAPSHVNAAYAPELFWDGRAGQTFRDPDNGTVILPGGGALENQVLGPPLSTGEMGHIGRDWLDAAARIASSGPLALAFTVPSDLATWIGGRSYAQLFQEAFGSAAVTGARIAMAIASYERTLFSTQTPFDAVIAGTAVLTPQEAAGQQVFAGAGCVGCHGGALMSDNQFHYIGVRPAPEDSGRAIVTHQLADIGAFRTPSLRNVALRPAFMHNGRFRTLQEVVDFYDRGGDFNAPNKDPRIVPLNLSPQQKAQLIAFLTRPLIDPRVAAETAPFDRPTLFTESGRVPQILTGGVAGSSGLTPQPVALEPPMTGNPRFTVGVFGAPGGAQATLVIDGDEPPVGAGIPAGGSFAHTTIALQGSGLDDGFGSATLAIPDDPALRGKVLFGRWYVADAGAPGGVAATPAFRMTMFGARGSEAPVAVLPAAAGGTLRLAASQPSPFRVSTVVSYQLAAASSVRLTVFDLAGRAVRRLEERANILPGVYSLTWDGNDDGGRAVPGGVYFYRLDAGREARTTRVVRLP
jgi:cytochrome c peroxidase